MESVVVRTQNRTLSIEWPEIEEACKLLAGKVPFKPDVILAIDRGGLIPAALVRRCFPHAKFKSVRTYAYQDRKFSGKVRIEQFNWTKLIGKKILVVDDIFDTGATIGMIFGKLSRIPNISYHAIALYSKPHAICYTGRTTSAVTLQHDVWIRFPWEVKE